MYIVDVIRTDKDKTEHIYRQFFHNIEMSRFVRGLNESYFIQVDEPEEVKTSSD